MENNSGHSPQIAARSRTHSPSRAEVLRAVEQGAHATADVVAATGLHENTVRGHLERLHADGYLARRRENPQGRGRPAWHWTAVSLSDPYAELALTLAEAMSQPDADPVSAARTAGTRWGERLASEIPANAPGDAWEHVLTAMTRQGFSPEPQDDAAQSSRISPAPRGASAPEAERSSATESAPSTDRLALLRRCPLLAAARGNERIVCTVHEGMIEGLAHRWAPAARAALTPFAQPQACAVHLLGAS